MNRQAIKYKVLLDKIYRRMKVDGAGIVKDELDLYLKTGAGVSGSTKTMSKEDLTNLIEYCYFVAEQIGIENKDEKL